MERIERPFTKRQREELEAIVAPSSQFLRALLFVIFTAAVGLSSRGLQHLLTDSMPYWLIPTALLAIWVYFRAGRWTGGPELRQQIRDDLAAGHVMMTILEPRMVEEVEEQEDEGPGYIITDVDGGMFLLTGQELLRYRLRKFPWSKIGVLETARSKRFLGLKKLGDPTAVSSRRSPFTYQQARDLGCFEKVFVELDESKIRLLAGS